MTPSECLQPLGPVPTERLRRRKQLGSVNFYATFHIWRHETSKENFAIAIAQWEWTFMRTKGKLGKSILRNLKCSFSQ